MLFYLHELYKFQRALFSICLDLFEQSKLLGRYTPRFNANTETSHFDSREINS